MVIRIKNKLKADGIEAHLPHMAEGKCKKPYAVVIDNGQAGAGNDYLGKKRIEILTYVPKNKYAQLATFKEQIKESLKDEDYLRRTGEEQQIIYLENIEGYMSSIGYTISKIL